MMDENLKWVKNTKNMRATTEENNVIIQHWGADPFSTETIGIIG